MMRKTSEGRRKRGMSLVDYAASDDDEEEEIGDLLEAGEGKGNQQRDSFDSAASSAPSAGSSPSVPPPNPPKLNSLVIDRSANVVSPLPPPSLKGLPDVSVLFDVPSSRVASAEAKSSARKRESNGSTLSQPSSKHPRGELRHVRNTPNTQGGLLVPPQLSGRSNVVTEDVGKLFVRKQGESSK